MFYLNILFKKLKKKQKHFLYYEIKMKHQPSNASNENSLALVKQDQNRLLDCKQQKSKPTQFNFGKCKVCKDKATGVHYGIPSCEGCKVIFE